ncbi:C-type lectin domain family 4 member M [Bagarius yarrelli]|uniref:C-type lectin domain family 4 member M n=1 Tax=Bagarius yarrelli TaxID=175774 RepID=A0A556UGW7_BAGYA|nr:C-type lectin domain family 4 member M [Bagarius yarrelli]
MSQAVEYKNYAEERGERVERVVEIYESIYAARGHILNTETEDVSMKIEHAGQDKKLSRCYTLTAVCMLLLCVLLLSALTVSWIKFNTLDTEKDQLQIIYNNLTEEKIYLQTSYNNLTEEKIYLQTSYNNLTEEKKQLSFNLTEEKNQLQTSYNNLTVEKNQLQTRYNNLTVERDRLQTEIDVLQKKLVLIDQYIKRGWSYFNFTLYFISTQLRNWDNSRNNCKALLPGADLEFILNLLTSNYEAWIGLSDKNKEKVWKWVDGTPLTAPYWYEGQPNNAKNADNCVKTIREKSQTSESIARVLEHCRNRGADRRQNHKTVMKNTDKKTQNTGPTAARDRSYILAVVCVFLLCFVLLIATTVLWIKYSILTKEKEQLQTTVELYNTLILERDQLHSRYKLLEVSYEKITLERDCLVERIENLTITKEELQNSTSFLQSKLDAIETLEKKKWKRFNTSLYYIPELKNWTESKKDCINKGGHLVIINSLDEEIREKSQTSESIARVLEHCRNRGADRRQNHKTVMKNTDKKTQNTGPTAARDRSYILAVVCVFLLCFVLLIATTVLWIKYSILTKEKEQLQTTVELYNTLILERDQLHSRYKLLEVSYEKITLERDCLVERTENLTITKEELQNSTSFLQSKLDAIDQRCCDSGFRVFYKSERCLTSECIRTAMELYENTAAFRCHNHKNETENANKKTQNTGDRCYKLAGVFVLLVCFLLLIATTVLGIKYRILTMEKEELLIRHKSLTVEKDDCQSRYKEITLENDYLKEGNQNLMREKEKLQSRLEYLETLENQKWKPFNSSLYYISEMKNWTESKEDCRNKGGHLVIINSLDEEVEKKGGNGCENC